MSNIVYKLVDGAFFEGLMREFGSYVGIDLFSHVYWERFRGNAHRTIYYDALPVQKDNQSDGEFRAIEERKLTFLNGLRALPNMQVRDGLTRLRTKSQGQKMSQIFEQKGVDTWIAVDALRYALSGLADEIHVYTSDADLYPAFDALQNTRSRGVLYFQPGRTANELIFSADRAVAITFSGAIDWVKASAGIVGPSDGSTRLRWKVLQNYQVGDTRFELVRDGSERLGCNHFHKDVFSSSRETMVNLFPFVADFINSLGGNVGYREMQQLILQ
jgi:uncharacterized LabA/DUF88 family protein